MGFRANEKRSDSVKIKNKLTKFLAVLLSFTISFAVTLNYLSRSQSERYEALVQKLLPKTVSISCVVTRKNPETGKKQRGRIGGAGVFITSKGHILTCAHLFDTFTVESISVEENNGWVFPATFVYMDEHRDLALIKIEDFNTPYANLARPDSLKEGQEVIAIGSPLGLDGSVSTGVISALHRDVVRYDMIQMSAPINPGNSGGPLFNLKGEIIGINVNIMTTNLFAGWSGLGFSVSASEINIFLTNVRNLGRNYRV